MLIEKRTWNEHDVADMCRDECFYGFGEDSDWERMLEFVKRNELTTVNIIKVARDIAEHSEDVTTTKDVAECIANTVCVTSFVEA